MMRLHCDATNRKTVRIWKLHWTERKKLVDEMENMWSGIDDDRAAFDILQGLKQGYVDRAEQQRQVLRQQYGIEIYSTELGRLPQFKFIGEVPKQTSLAAALAFINYCNIEVMVHLIYHQLVIKIEIGSGKTWCDCLNDVKTALIEFLRTDPRQKRNAYDILARFAADPNDARALENLAAVSLIGYVDSRINRIRNPDLPADLDEQLPGAVTEAILPLFKDLMGVPILSGDAESVRKLVDLQKSVTQFLEPTKKRNDAMKKVVDDPEQAEMQADPAGHDFTQEFMESEIRKIVFQEIMNADLPPYIKEVVDCLRTDPDQTNAEIARKLKRADGTAWTEGAVKAAKFRLRQKFPDAVDLLK